ncbi:MAG TPA: PPC domain-containing DNA-binding protein [Alphaproteobacteria bacterium]|nr:PPC domain-containing DNA-binding protein [Alphaproteobacteria bacterium]
MRAKILQGEAAGLARSERTFALVFETGDEAISGLTAFAKERSLTACHFTAIGAFSDLTLGFFDWEKKDYQRLPIKEQVEVLSFVGDIALKDGEPMVHGHVVVGKADGSAHGGHLLEAHVRPTLELILIESPNFLQRKFDQETGLALIDIGAAG